MAIDEHGGEHVVMLAAHVIVGGGPAAVLDAATLPGAGKVVGADGDEVIDPRVFAISREDHGAWHGREGKTGQGPGEYAGLPTAHPPADMLEQPADFMPIGAFADNLDLTADAAGLATARGWTVIRLDATPDASWRVADAARRLVATDAAGRTRYFYARKVDVAGGLGPARRLDVEAFVGADPTARGEARDQLEAAGVIVSAERHLSGAAPAARILITGGGATAPWNVQLATARNRAARIDWISARSSNPAAAAERARVDAEVAHLQAAQAELERQLADVDGRLVFAFRNDERADLDARAGELAANLGYLRDRQTQLLFGDAMAGRNLGPDQAFAMASVTLAGKQIASIAALPSPTGGPPRARVTFSDGSADVYDQIIVNHGSEASAPGGAAAMLAGEQLGIVPTGTRAHLASADGAVRVFGAAAFAATETPFSGSSRRSRLPDRGAFMRTTGYAEQPAGSAGVPSFFLAGEQIREANQ